MSALWSDNSHRTKLIAAITAGASGSNPSARWASWPRKQRAPSEPTVP
jgi:hypothetical protein